MVTTVSSGLALEPQWCKSVTGLGYNMPRFLPPKVNLYSSYHGIFLMVHMHEVNRGMSKVSTSFLWVTCNYFLK